ncbi:protein PHR1-LIKE 1-like isoform X2 [Pistacia vera]|uniref:protein PHR1-LIKE 1-like isoform X2 n=1 Tax=Pistacia vera TaxID=55513 RepID=UPI001262CEC1|nr:protein PHR1-LIKE 1-like isoform X2 [Pistacia vera]
MEQEGGGSQQHQQNLKPLQDLATVIYLNNDQSDINFQQQYGQQLGETPATSGENFSGNFTEQDTLESVVKPHLFSGNFSRNFPGTGLPYTPDSSQNMIKESLFRPQEMQSSEFVSIASSKKRIRWTQDLHEEFLQCVYHLGGADKATPKAIFKLMKKPSEFTITNIKSHLQKYRSENCMSNSAQERSIEEGDCISDIPQLYSKTGKQIREALQLQMNIQKQLHQQLETDSKRFTAVD